MAASRQGRTIFSMLSLHGGAPGSTIGRISGSQTDSTYTFSMSAVEPYPLVRALPGLLKSCRSASVKESHKEDL